MYRFAGPEDVRAVESHGPWPPAGTPATVHEMLSRTAAAHPARPAVAYQLTSDPKDRGETVTWAQMLARTHRAANLFRSLGVNEGDAVAYVLPNCLEALYALMGGLTAGIAAPVNPLLDAAQIASILRETKAKVVVTLRPFPKTDIAQKVAEAVAEAPEVTTVLEVDLLRYLSPPKSWIVPLIRPKVKPRHRARTLSFTREMARQPEALTFTPPAGEAARHRIGACFHTGGTTGMPKVAQHDGGGMVYNGWIGASLLFTEEDVLMCPLPLFHVFAVQVAWMAAVASGAQIVFPTPAGYRGEGVFDNFWKLLERHRATFLITVPTAISALMQRPVNADVSALKLAFSGSAPLPVDLYRRFEAATGVTIVEGYGLTEATCLVSCNPVQGEKKIGSVGVPFPYSEVRIVGQDGETRAAGEVGEICVASPGVRAGATYSDPAKNRDLYRDERFLRTGDLGRLDEGGYLWITGRAKDLIIRGGHNIDPAVIEDAMAGHPAVAMAGAIGQPDAHAGEVPCVYVELVQGGEAGPEDLMEHARSRIGERAAWPKHIEILRELPKTAVGKVFKPDLRRLAIARVLDAALAEAGSDAAVAEVVEDRRHGLLARIRRGGEGGDEAAAEALGRFAVPWEWAEG